MHYLFFSPPSRPPPHPRDMRAIAGELLQLCDDFMPRPQRLYLKFAWPKIPPGNPGEIFKKKALTRRLCAKDSGCILKKIKNLKKIKI